MNIPTSWIYDYIDLLPEGSLSRKAIVDMMVKFMKEQEEQTTAEGR